MSDETAVLAANAAYYRAFATADAAAMSRVWADDKVSCIHPGWPALVGREPILESYRQIFSNPHQDRIEPRNELVMITGDLARVLCVEFVAGNALATTNLFRRVGNEWLMTHHQASPIAALLEEPESQPPPGRLNELAVMPGLVPGIHVLLDDESEGVDGRDKPGHDDAEFASRYSME